MHTFFITGYLPPLEFNVKPSINLKELTELLEMNLPRSSLEKLKVLKLWIDLSNLEKMILGGSLDTRGNYTKEALVSFLQSEEELPEYVFTFFSAFESLEERKRFFPKLLTTYFREEEKKAKGFLKKFLKFEHEYHIIMMGIRAKRFKKDAEKELIFEDHDNPFVRYVLQQRGSPGKFIFPFEYLDLEKLIEGAGPNPTKQYLALGQYRFDYYDQGLEGKPFSLETILAYFMKLWILEDLFTLNQEKGETLLENLVENQNAS